MSLARVTAALADRYRIERELGAGGMATVYLARDLRHDRNVAIKVLHQDLGDTLGPERFLAEIKTTARLQHPHILPLLDSGSTATEGRRGGLLYYVMPYVEGETLRDRLSRETQLPIEDAVRIAREVADALGNAHSHGVIHRDIKPENILLQDGHALVADFGIALALQQAGGKRLTQTGLALGTPQYMAPEQALGEKTVDHHADIYALGAVTYEMLTGEPPFTGATAQTIAAKMMSERPPAPAALRDTVPEVVSAAVMKALAKLPADRFDSASRFADSLRGAWAGEAARPTRARGRTRWREDRRLLAMAGLAMISLGAAGYLLWLRTAGEGPMAGLMYSQKTFAHEAIFNARFAPDGQTIVFSAAPEGNTPRLFVIRPDYPAPQPFGPDSTHLLAVASTGEIAILLRATFLTHRLFQGMLARMPIGGGAPREVLADVREADWSPDGEDLAIIHEVGGKDHLEYPIGHSLYETPGYLSDLRIAPGGDAIAFFEHPSRWDDRGDVVLIDLRGRRTVLASDFNGLEGLAWSADGTTVLFSGALEGGLFQVRGVSRRGRVRRALANAGALTMQDVARDGRWIVTRDDQRTQIVLNSPDRPGGRDLSWLDLPHMAVLSADGRWLAFSDQSALGGINYTAMVQRTDGSPAVRLGEGSPQDISQDGGWVVAIVPATPNRLVLYPVGAGSSRPLDLPGMLRYSSAQFFRDGKRLLICGSKATGGSTCYVQSLAGGPASAVTPEGTEYARVSPDGRFVLAAGIGRGFSLHAVAGGTPRDLPGIAPNEYVTGWSPDSRAVWVQSANGLGEQIDRVEIATGRRSPFFRIEPAQRAALVSISLPTIADDPRYHAYEMLTYESRMFVVAGAR